MNEANKIHIGSEKILPKATKQLMLEMNYIMPDNKPRINSVADTDVKSVISSASLVGNTLNFTVAADCTLIYNAISVSENEEHLYTAAASFSKSFKESLDFDIDEVAAIAESTSYVASVSLNNVETVIISDRKAIVKAFVTVEATLKQTVGIDAVSSFTDESIITKHETAESVRSVGVMRVQSFLKEDVTLSETLPSVDLILLKDASVTLESQKISDSKAIFYGTAHVDTVYSNMEQTPKFYSVGFDINFNQATEIPDVSESAGLLITPVVTELSIDAKENNVLSVEMLISFDVEVFDYFGNDIIGDAFLPGMELNLTCDKAVGSNSFVITNNVGACSEKLYVPDADIDAVLFSRVRAVEQNARIENKNIYFDGIYSVKSYYVPKSDPNIIRTVTTDIPYSYMFEAGQARGNIIFSAVNVRGITSQLNDFGEINVKWIASTVAVVAEEVNCKIITSASANELTSPVESGIFYHFIANGESAWDIAKQFGITPEILCRMNGAESEQALSAMKGVVIIRQ